MNLTVSYQWNCHTCGAKNCDDHRGWPVIPKPNLDGWGICDTKFYCPECMTKAITYLEKKLKRKKV